MLISGSPRRVKLFVAGWGGVTFGVSMLWESQPCAQQITGQTAMKRMMMKIVSHVGRLAPRISRSIAVSGEYMDNIHARHFYGRKMTTLVIIGM